MRSALAAISVSIVAFAATSGCSTPSPASSASTSPGTTGGTATTPKEVKYYENGDHVVGTDIKAGVYRAEVEESAISLCTVSQTSSNDKVMDIRNANGGSGIFTVTNKKGSVVSFSGCAKIAEANDVLRKNAKPGDGWFLVGSEIAPGKYSCKVDTESLVKLGTITQHSAKGTVMGIRNANAGNVVFTVKKSPGSVVNFSGFSSVKKTG